MGVIAWIALKAPRIRGTHNTDERKSHVLQTTFV